MNTVYVLFFCVVVSLALTVLFVVILSMPRRRTKKNVRGHRLGRLLAISHPEWN